MTILLLLVYCSIEDVKVVIRNHLFNLFSVDQYPFAERKSLHEFSSARYDVTLTRHTFGFIQNLLGFL